MGAKDIEVRSYPLGHRQVASAGEELFLIETPGPRNRHGAIVNDLPVYRQMYRLHRVQVHSTLLPFYSSTILPSTLLLFYSSTLLLSYSSTLLLLMTPAMRGRSDEERLGTATLQSLASAVSRLLAAARRESEALNRTKIRRFVT